MKKIIALIMAMAMVLTLSACTTKKAEKSAKNHEMTDGETESTEALDTATDGKLVIGYTIYEPMNYEDENGEFTGFDTELAKAVCKKLGVEPEFVEIDWDNKFLELDSRNIDCIWNGMTITNEVKKNADVTKAYVKNAQVVVMKADRVKDIKSVDDLKGLKFAAEAGSAGEEAIIDNGLDEKYVAASGQTDALLEVESGAADACVIDITMANAMTGANTSYSDLAAGLELTSEEYGIAFAKGSNLTKKVNAALDELKADGTLDKLADKYELTLAF